uniref:Germinal-center associated nuclear protein n=1 Tax=Scleropages formosus TaxID=113540 RepID=A0A8C9WGI3_SCLFO
MNSSNLFGTPQAQAQAQAGAFQAPAGQGRGFSCFGQPPASGASFSAFSPPSSFGQAPAFEQRPAGPGHGPLFGQPGGTSSALSSAFALSSGLSSQAPAFGQPPLGQLGTPGGFGAPLSGPPQSAAFGQFEQTRPTPGFGVSPGISQAVSAMTALPVSSGRPLGISQFSAPTTSVQNRGFGPSGFTFKSSDTALFKPIFSVSSKPSGSRVGTGSEPSSSAQPAAPSMGGAVSSAAFLPRTGAAGSLRFSFSPPAAAPSISAQSGSGLPSKDVLPAANLQFTVSQATAVPSSPSLFSFAPSTLQPLAQTTMPLFRVFSQASAFSDLKAKTEASPGSGDKAATGEGLGEALFGSLGKGTKRKEETAEQATGEGQAAEESLQAGLGAPRHPSKRPLIKSRGPTSGLFRNALSSVIRSSLQSAKRDSRKVEEPPPGKSLRGQRRQVMDPEPEAKTPAKCTQRGESTDSLAGLSPSDATAIQCKNVPTNLNRKEIMRTHFSRFGRVLRVFCRPQKNLAIIHFQDHASATRAKKRGKLLHRQELAIFWHRKKPSKAPLSEQDPVPEAGDSTLADFHSSPLRKPLSRPSAPSNSGSLTKGSPVKKPQIAKSLQFESEPQNDPSPELHGSDRPAGTVPLPSSLLHLVGQVAETSEDKYRLLEQRDKILRQGRPRRTELDLSKVFVGTCPDMCPEKERYMRETRNQLSSFEVIPDTEKVDHATAIKEYSRSSADQEEPLPHDLRPLPVLSMTMDYLVTRIMDQGDDNLRDWYDFVWNRTRGIRKDITQQHLCDPLTVSLIEKCARFHIHCAHHLCQEPMMSFDAKINNENLTKCLQSLKEMYQDLATRGVYCIHEAEFRGYSVLLKLNDGDILREVQQFRAEVRNSPEVNFAVQAFAALNNNNFVRFFKLVKAASYLSSCILHRYFNQVRSLALRNLNTAYTVGSRGSTNFPLDDLVRMLMFRNTAEAADFVQQYGLSVESGMVELTRTAFQDPELPLPPKRSMAIMNKRTVLVGEVVNGGSLPSPPQHTPFCSFDSRHKYRGEGPLLDHPRPGRLYSAWSCQEFSTLSYLAHISLVTFHFAISFIDFFFFFYTRDLATEVESVVDEVVEAECAELAATAASYISAALSECNGQVEAVVSEVLGQMLREVSTVEIQAEKERVAEEKRRIEEARSEHEAFLTDFSKSLCSEIAQEVLQECIAATAAAEIRYAQEEKAACVARSSEEVCRALLEETLRCELATMAQEILDAELRRIHKFLRRWRDVVAVRRQLKRQMRGFPAAPCCVDPHFKLQALAPSAPSTPCLELLARGIVSLGHGGNVTLSCTRSLKMRQEALRQMKVHYYFEQLLNESVWMPLDLATLVAESVPRPVDKIFWKAALLLPSDHESDSSTANRILTDWLESKFRCGKEPDDVWQGNSNAVWKTSLCFTHLVICETWGFSHVITITQVARGPLSEDGQAALEKQKDLMGTSALLMLLPAMPTTEGKDEEYEGVDVFLLSALLQLKQVQQANAWPQPLPLALVVPGQAGQRISDRRLEEDLMLKSLVEDGLISEYVFVHIPETTNDLQGSKQVSQVVKWLASRSPAPVQLSSQTLVQFVEMGLCQEFTNRLHHDQQERKRAGLLPQEPMPIIQLYNATLDFLAGLISSPELSALSWPVAEFTSPGGCDLLPHLDWNSLEHLEWLRRTVLSLHLPDWDLPPPSASWTCLVASIFQYASQVPSSRHSQPLLMSRLENLLEKVQSWRGQQRSPGLRDDEMAPSFRQVPWDEIVTLCIDHRLKDWKPSEHLASKDAICEDGEIMVYFPKDGLRGFLPPPCWLEAERQTHRDKQQKAHSNPEYVVERLLCFVLIDWAPCRFEEQLQRWLKMDPLDSFTMPLFVPSTLLSVPEIMVASPKTAPTSLARPVWEKEPGDHGDSVKPDWPKGVPVSIAQRLRVLEQLISASREEEVACGLKLSSLLDIVED